MDREYLRTLDKGIREEMWRGGNRGNRAFAKTLPQKFASGGQRVGRAMRVYTDTRPTGLGTTLGVFTRWAAGEIYETGGTIVPVKGEWLVIPLAPWLMTPTGSVRRQFRDAQTGSYSDAAFEGTFPLRVSGSVMLLMGPPPTVKRRQKLPSGRRSRTKGRFRIGPAIQPVFLLVKRVRKEAVLGFEDHWSRFEVIGEKQAARIADRAARRVVQSTGVNP